MNSNKKVLVGLSGGVDSTAAAYLLKKRGYEVIGITFKLFEPLDESNSIDDAKRIADKLKIDHFIYDYKKTFENKVINPFVREYLSGKTPNPCLMCNKAIKFGLFFELLEKHNADYIATGHYIKKEYDQKKDEYYLKKSNVENKDQSYFLHFLTQNELKKVLFPIGDMESKESVKKLVEKFDPGISSKDESVSICFTKNKNHKEFIDERIDRDISGNIIDLNGNFLGKHDGIYNYTIGQKRNIGIDLEETKYVVEIDGNENKIILGEDKDTYSRGLIAEDVNFINDYKGIELEAKICQWGYYLKCTIEYLENKKRIKVLFDQDVRAIAPGQAVVFYNNDVLVGGGIIKKVLR